MYSSSPPGGGSLINTHTVTVLQPSQSIKELMHEGSRVQGAAAVALAQSHTPHVRAHPSSAPSTRADCLIAGHILCTCSRPLLFSPHHPPSLTAADPCRFPPPPVPPAARGPNHSSSPRVAPPPPLSPPSKAPHRNPPFRLVPSPARHSFLLSPDSLHPSRPPSRTPKTRASGGIRIRLRARHWKRS